MHGSTPEDRSRRLRDAWEARAQARELGDRVRRRRKELRLSQEKLGERAELHRTYIGQIERGEVNITVRNLLALSDALEVDPGTLVAGLGLDRPRPPG